MRVLAVEALPRGGGRKLVVDTLLLGRLCTSKATNDEMMDRASAKVGPQSPREDRIEARAPELSLAFPSRAAQRHSTQTNTSRIGWLLLGLSTDFDCTARELFRPDRFDCRQQNRRPPPTHLSRHNPPIHNASYPDSPRRRRRPYRQAQPVSPSVPVTCLGHRQLRLFPELPEGRAAGALGGQFWEGWLLTGLQLSRWLGQLW